MARTGFARGAFTRIELVVVCAALLVLVAFVQPLRGTTRRFARPASCGWNLSQIGAALAAYQADHGGWLPMTPSRQGAVWSEASWWVRKRELWFYQIVPQYLRTRETLICPQDPFADQFDFEAELDGVPHSNQMVPSCGYGLSYGLRHWSKMRLANTPPQSPSLTVLLAEVGPDAALVPAPLYQSPEGSVAQPWRDGGRFVWDDAVRPWYDGPTWLTTRHGQNINMAAVDGSVRKARTAGALQQGPITSRLGCMRPSVVDGIQRYRCPLCRSMTAHYDLSESNWWFWTGPLYP